MGCDTYERVFKIVRLKVYHRPIGGIEMVGLIGLPLTNMRYRNGWIESVISYIEYNNRFVVSFGKFFAEVYFFCDKLLTV